MNWLIDCRLMFYTMSSVFAHSLFCLSWEINVDKIKTVLICWCLAVLGASDLNLSDIFSFIVACCRCQQHVLYSCITVVALFFSLCIFCRFKLTQIAVDTSAGPFKNYTVVFLGSDNGHVLKILASTEGANASFSTQLLEDIDVYNPNK